MSDLKKKLTEVEDNLKKIPRIEEIEDIFHKIIPVFFFKKYINKYILIESNSKM